jgi:hypothetical protein
MNLTIQICGKVTGENEQECKEKFENAENLLCKAGAQTVINPLKLINDWEKPWEEAMNICIMSIIENANAIYLLNDWDQSRGAMDEHRVAIKCGRMIFKEDELDQIKVLTNLEWADTSDVEWP